MILLQALLRLGAIPTLSPYLIPLILKPLRERYPKLKLALTDEVTASLTDKLANHEIDAALLATPIKAPGYDSLLLFDEPFWLAHLSKHPALHTRMRSAAKIWRRWRCCCCRMCIACRGRLCLSAPTNEVHRSICEHLVWRR